MQNKLYIKYLDLSIESGKMLTAKAKMLKNVKMQVLLLKFAK